MIDSCSRTSANRERDSHPLYCLGYQSDIDGYSEGLHQMAPLYLPNTRRLTLSVQHATELELILRRNVTPVLEHLSVTIERMDLLVIQAPESPFRLCEQNLRQKADGTRLRALLLRHISFDDLIVLLDSLSMPSLETLTLLDVYGQSKRWTLTP